jgi:hypothetical protein
MQILVNSLTLFGVISRAAHTHLLDVQRHRVSKFKVVLRAQSFETYNNSYILLMLIKYQMCINKLVAASNLCGSL